MLRSVKYGLYGAVLAGLVAAPVAYAAVDKSVHLVVDGQAQTVSTSAADVRGVLAAKHLRLGEHDLLAPGGGTQVTSGMTIVLRHGHLLDLDVNGARRQIWTTEPTVSQALGDLGYTSADFVSVSRSTRLPLTPTSIAIRSPLPVTVVHDGTREKVNTTDTTVGQLLSDIDVQVGPADRLSVPSGSQLSPGEVIVLGRAGGPTITRTVEVAYETTLVADPSMPVGTTRVSTTGTNGTMSIVYVASRAGGKLVPLGTLDSSMVHAPRAEVLQVGTKGADVAAAAGSITMNTPSSSASSSSSSGSSGGSSGGSFTAPAPGTAKAIALALMAKRGWGNDQFDCLDQMWTRESGWRTDAANSSGAYGIPQALPGSKMASAGPDWQSNATTQITWGLNYIASRYNTPCGAWAWWQAHDWY